MDKITIINNLVSTALSVAGTLLILLISYYLEKKAKLVYYFQASSNFVLPAIEGRSAVKIYTHSIVLCNIGKQAAEQVEMYTNFKSTNFSIFPAVKHEVEELDNDDMTRIIKFDYIEPKTNIVVSFLYDYPFEHNLFIQRVRSKSGEAKQINVFSAKQLSPFVKYQFLLLYLVGVFSVIFIVSKYFLLKLFGL